MSVKALNTPKTPTVWASLNILSTGTPNKKTRRVYDTAMSDTSGSSEPNLFSVVKATVKKGNWPKDVDGVL